MDTLQFFLFGGFRILHSDGLCEVEMVRSVQPLLAYLLLYRYRAHSREKLTDLLWGDCDGHRARGRLRTALCRLRQGLESEGICPHTYLMVAPSGEIGFNQGSDHWLDVAAFEAQVEQVLVQPVHTIQPADAGRLENAMKIYVGELLEGFYDDWVLWERERLQRLYLNSLAYLLRYYRCQGAYDQGLECGHKILLYDPLREEIHREIMQLYLESGQRALAARQYRACREILASELNIEPMEETQALYELAAPEANLHPSQCADSRQLACVQHALQQICLGMEELQGVRNRLQQAIDLIRRAGVN